MKKILALLLAVSLGSVSYSQEVMPSLTAGSKALLFTFGGLSNVSANNFSGGFGAKYFLSSSMAVRAGLQFSSASTKTPPGGTPAAGDVSADATTSSTTIGIGGAVELHMGSGRVSPYLGGGVGFSTTSTESKNPPYQAPPPVVQTVTKNAGGSTTISIYGMAGFEFFLWKEASLSGEYRLGFSSTSNKDIETTVGANPTTTTKQGSSTNIGIAAQGVLTLAVYL